MFFATYGLIEVLVLLRPEVDSPRSSALYCAGAVRFEKHFPTG